MSLYVTPSGYEPESIQAPDVSRRCAEINQMVRMTLGEMIRTVLVVSISFCDIAASLAMPADAQRPENSESAKIGREVAQRHCSVCHAIDATGASSNPKSPPFPLIAERFENDNPAPVLIDGTVIRHPGMPEFRLLEHETDGLVAYIRRISRRWKPTVD